MTESVRMVTDSQWRYLHQKINALTDIVFELKQEVKEYRKPKRGLRFWESIPSERECNDVLTMLNFTTSYDGFINRLAGFYDCEPMGVYRDENVDPKYKAIYHKHKKACYSRGPTIDRQTVLHEFFHHLVAQGVVFVKKHEEEEKADRYAEVFLKRAGWELEK